MSQTTNDGAGDCGGSADLTTSERHSLLAATRRRAALAAVVDEPMPVGLDTLARATASREPGVDPSSEETLRRVTISLHHTHLPKMHDLGVVDYDPHRQHVIECRVGPVVLER